MTDVLPEHWGVWPILGRIAGLPVSSYAVFMTLAILAGAAAFHLAARRSDAMRQSGWQLVAAALLGGALGAKLPVWMVHAREIVAALPDVTPLLSGRTIVGGLLGGTLAVVLARRRLGLSTPSGDLFAPGIALGLAIGRLGCFCRGCCYGTATLLPWGVDFGDGIPRHPTQLYEAAFGLALFAALPALRRRLTAPGQSFAVLMIGYFIFRFLIEFVRAGERPYGGLTLAQLASAGVAAYYLYRETRRPVAPPAEEQHAG